MTPLSDLYKNLEMHGYDGYVNTDELAANILAGKVTETAGKKKP